ncbi:GtrA family protein [Pseudoblastomonas halimionae]|uniref:GtrA family protein n=1 Tax=Alteriqipengyuania halimionae TaxID=1926630 RepID=A0A6I4U866_9SPHN|nr:GtrA family protein [Alteriqipengyuania halimionae]MXP10652.1 GtrA family protein [Alteriqipengyuania halimionae]
MRAVRTHVIDIRIVRYIAASVGALAVDMGLFLGLLAVAMPAAAAASLSYCAGIVAHWLFSSRAVFQDRVANSARGRHVQKALFVGSALVGLALTTGIVGLFDFLGSDPLFGKLVAVAASFVVTWLIRSRVVFRAEG